MESLKIEGTHKTPRVELDKEANKFKIEGRSRPEDPDTFFEPINNWISQYADNPNDVTNIEFNMEYFNTASSRAILKILNKLDTLREAGRNVKISWYHQEDDIDMREIANEFSAIVSTPIEVIPK